MTFSISAKIQDDGQNLEKSKFFKPPREVALSAMGVQNLTEITLSLTVFEISDIFYFLSKFKMTTEIRKSLNYLEVLEE